MALKPNKSLLGTCIDCQSIPIDKALLDRFVRAYPNSLIPANRMPSSALGTLGNYEAAYNALGLTAQIILHTQESIRATRPVLLGDQIEVSTTFKDLYEQAATNGPMGFLVLSVVGKHKKDVVFEVERTVAIRGGFPRRS